MDEESHGELLAQWEDEYRQKHGSLPPQECVDEFWTVFKQGIDQFKELNRQRTEVQGWKTLFGEVPAGAREGLRADIETIRKSAKIISQQHPRSFESKKIFDTANSILQKLGLTVRRGVRTAVISTFVGEKGWHLVDLWGIQKRTAARIIFAMTEAAGYEVVYAATESAGVKAVEDRMGRIKRDEKVAASRPKPAHDPDRPSTTS